MNPNTPNNKSGFTLIELLMVIAVIGILAGILIPSVSKVRLKAMRTESVSNLRQLHNAFSLFAQDNQGALPNSWIAANENTNRKSSNWRKQLVDGGYLSQADAVVRSDPSNPENYSILGSPLQRELAPHLTTEHSPVLHATYSMNGTIASSGGKNPNVPTARLINFINPAKTLLISEGTTFGRENPFNVAIWPTTPPDFTGDTVALLYVDGHVEEMLVSEFPVGSVGANERDKTNWYFWRGQI